HNWRTGRQEPDVLLLRVRRTTLQRSDHTDNHSSHRSAESRRFLPDVFERGPIDFDPRSVYHAARSNQPGAISSDAVPRQYHSAGESESGFLGDPEILSRPYVGRRSRKRSEQFLLQRSPDQADERFFRPGRSSMEFQYDDDGAVLQVVHHDHKPGYVR